MSTPSCFFPPPLHVFLIFSSIMPARTRNHQRSTPSNPSTNSTNFPTTRSGLTNHTVPTTDGRPTLCTAAVGPDAPIRPSHQSKRSAKRACTRLPADTPGEQLEISSPPVQEQPTNQNNDAEATPNLQNYLSLLKSWPPGRIRKYISENRASNKNRVPADVLERAKLVFNMFNHELLMLAMIGGVSLATIKSYVCVFWLIEYASWIPYHTHCPLPL